ncbi:hypothetical protein ABFS83_14G230400 [Erythranthe nasuta]
MSSGKRWKFKNLFTANGTNCGCGMKPTDVFEPKPKSKTTLSSDQKPSIHSASSTTTTSDWDRSIGASWQPVTDGNEDYTSTTFSHDIENSPEFCPENYLDHHPNWPKTVNPCRRIQDSLAVVKDSEDPYQDFRQSMLQMIFEKEIYTRSGLQQLLHCFLELNLPRHHQTIVQAFADIWNNGGGVAVSDGGEEETPP